ncbi:MAG: helix-turn-helix domain-containing protein [Lachnospiraceae bacterium]|nr:helix-turn-helix domain-containing protein [Lachnospiraceae bacterium]
MFKDKKVKKRRVLFARFLKKRRMLRIKEGLKMSVFIAKRLRETRISANLSQEEVAEAMKISRRKLQSIEANEASVSVDDILEFAKLYKVDVRELILAFSLLLFLSLRFFLGFGFCRSLFLL